MRKMGDLYFYGDSATVPNASLAAYWYRKSAEKGDPEAMFNYAVCLERGLGVLKNRFEAFKWFEKSAEKGVKLARFNVAMTYLSGIPGDPEKKIPPMQPSPGLAVFYLDQLAGEDFLKAEIVLAEICLEQRNNPEYLKKACALLQKMTARPNPPPQALRMLADCKYGGLGMPKDLSGMIDLLRRAEQLGDGEAAGKLAQCYEFGRGVPPDEKKAFELYRKGARAGNAMSAFKYGEMLLSGKFTKAPDTEKAVRVFRFAAKKGNVNAITKLGILHLEGIGVDKSEEKAAEYFFEAAKKNYPDAQYNLACMFARGFGAVPKDDAAAVYWFGRAAIGGDAASCRILAVRYFEGRGVPRSITKGEKWLEHAVKLGDNEAIQLQRSRRQGSY